MERDVLAGGGGAGRGGRAPRPGGGPPPAPSAPALWGGRAQNILLPIQIQKPFAEN
jgi:hypothetical protein